MRIKTKSFDLAVHIAGDLNSEKLAIILPGRLDSKDYPHITSHVKTLGTLGYFAISFDPPGTWETSNNIDDYTMTNYLKAIEEVIEYYNNKPTLVVGHSRGGSMAILAGLKINQVFAFISIMSRNIDKKLNRKWQETGYVENKRDLPNSSTEFKTYKLPFNFYLDSLQYDLKETLSTCIKPKLFVLGLQDITVKPEDVIELYNEAGNPKEYKELDYHHDYRDSNAEITKVDQILIDFIQKL